MAVMLRLAADGLELLYVYRKHWGVSPDAPDNDSNVGADTMTVVWLCPTSKQHLGEGFEFFFVEENFRNFSSMFWKNMTKSI